MRFVPHPRQPLPMGSILFQLAPCLLLTRLPFPLPPDEGFDPDLQKRSDRSAKAFNNYFSQSRMSAPLGSEAPQLPFAIRYHSAPENTPRRNAASADAVLRNTGI